MILVTGQGRSGTTFTTSLFRELGFRLLPEIQNEYPHVGLEGRTKDLSLRMAEARSPAGGEPDFGLGYTRPWTREAWNAELPQDLIDDVQNLDADVIKAPHAMKVLGDWLSLRGDVEGVVFCFREMNAVMDRLTEIEPQLAPESVLGGLLQSLGRAFWAVAEHDVPYTVLWFPQSATDSWYAWCQLHPFLDCEYGEFERVHESVVEPEYLEGHA